MRISFEGTIGIALALLGILGGGAFMRFPDQAWIGTAMMAIAVVGLLMLVWHQYNARHQKPTEQPKSRPLEYLGSTDCELSSAIRAMAHKSAWGRWYAAQNLAMSGSPIGEKYLLDIASSVVREQILDGALVVRGRLPDKIEYLSIDQTFWRSTVLLFLPDNISLWKLHLAPVGGFVIEPGRKMKADHKPSEKRNAIIKDYDSLLVNALQFESLWPKADKIADTKRKKFLKVARKKKLDSDTIKALS